MCVISDWYAQLFYHSNFDEIVYRFQPKVNSEYDVILIPELENNFTNQRWALTTTVVYEENIDMQWSNLFNDTCV